MVDVVSGCIDFGVGIVVDVDGELYELVIELLFPLLHGLGEEGFSEVGIGVGVAHGLKLLGNRLPSWWASETEGILVGVQFVNVSIVRFKGDWSPKNVYGFVNPFGVESGVETLKMAPSRLFSRHGSHCW